MKHHKRQVELQSHHSQAAEMPSYMTVCICLVDKQYTTYFQIDLDFICFILPLQMSLTVSQYFYHYEAS